MPQQDIQVWEAFRQGDRGAFEQLYNLHIHMLIAYGMRMTSEQTVVKDAIQDLFIELWHSRAQLSSVRTVRGYLLKALRYKLMRNAHIRILYFADPSEQADTADNIEAAILENETAGLRKEQLRRAIGKLPRRQQEVINLRFYHGCTTEDVTDIMGINYQSAINLLHRAILHLRSWLDVM